MANIYDNIRVPNMYVVYNRGRQLYWPKEGEAMLSHKLHEARTWEYGSDAREFADSTNKKAPNTGQEWSAYRVNLEKV